MNNGLRFRVLISIVMIATGVCVAQDDSAESPALPVLTGPYLGQEPPGDTPVLFAPEIVATGKEHSAAMFTPDGNEVWFGRMFPAKIYYMKRVNDRWTEPITAPFCDTFNYLYPVLAGGGDRLFFTSDRPVEPSGGRLPRSKGDIWTVERTPTGWSEPEHLGHTVNFSLRNSCGSTAADGSLYFTAKVPGRSMDIFCSRRIDGKYAAPENLEEIDSPTPDHCPFVAPDESYLIFSSFQGGQGRSDLFISFRNTDGEWTRPINMGPGINSAYKDEYPFVTPDGRYLFFNSNRPSSLNQKPIPDGPGNIYWVSAAVIDKLRRRTSD